MRFRLAFLILAAPAMAIAADATAPGGKITVVTQVAKPPPTPIAATATPKLESLATPTPTDGADCRMSCAQTYYFCRAGDHADDCPGGWTQCVAACNSPNLSPDTSTAP